jgi:outer membrane protein TolC
MKNKFILLLCGIVASASFVWGQRKINLEQAIDLALRNNPSVKVARDQISIAEAKTMQARSTLYPQTSILSKYFFSNNLPSMYPLEGVSVPVLNNGIPTGDNIIMHPMAPYPDRARDVLTFDLNALYPIYTGEKRKNAVKSTEELKNSYTSNLKDTEGILRLKVKKAYYNNLFLDEVLDVYHQMLDQFNRHLKLAKIAYREGVRSEFDVLNFESKIEEFQYRITEIEGKKIIAGTALKNLLALPDTADITVEGTLTDHVRKVMPPVLSLDDIKNGNHKLQSLIYLRDALNRKKMMEAAGKRPTIFTFGNYHIYHGMDFPPFDETWRNGFAIGVGLKINLFDGNMTKGKVREMEAAIDRINNYQEGLRLQLRYQYNEAMENIQSLIAQKKAAEEHLAVAEKAYSIAETGYENGVITNIELNDAQLNMTKVKLSILNIEKTLLLEYARLEYLSGGKN